MRGGGGKPVPCLLAESSEVLPASQAYYGQGILLNSNPEQTGPMKLKKSLSQGLGEGD